MEETKAIKKIHTLVAIGNLKVSENYQRILNTAFVKLKTRDFDPVLVNDIHVSKRDNGDLYVIDGQHTVEILRNKFGNRHMANAYVYTGLSMKQEAEMFYKINSGRRKPSYNELLKSKLEAEDPEVVEYFNILNGNIEYAYQHSGNKTKFDSHQSGLTALRKYGKDAFTRALKAADGKQHEYKSGSVIKGLSKFYFDHPEAKDEFVSAALLRNLYEDMRKLASVYNKGANNAKEDGWCKAITDYYNKGRRSGRLN